MILDFHVYIFCVKVLMYERMLKWALLLLLLLLFHANASFANTYVFKYAKIKHETWQWQRQTATSLLCMANYEITFPPIVSVS